MSNKKLLGWHFVAANKRLSYDDGREVKSGEVYTVDGARLGGCEPALGSAVVVWRDPRFLDNIVAGARADGLSVA